MKVLVLNGSPKKKSDTMEFTKAFLKGLNKSKENEIEILNIIDMNIAPCRGCLGCWSKGDGTCLMDDDQNYILKQYVKADLVIWSFPLYCFGFPSHLKAVLDRMIPMVKMDMVERNGEVRHVCNEFFQDTQKTIIICGAGFPMSDRNFDGVKITSEKCFHNPFIVCVPEAPLMNIPEAKIVADPKREAFERAGEEFNNTLSLADETIEELESLMISNEEYLRNINGK